MSTPLQVLDLSSLTVGQAGKLDLTPAAPSANPAYTNQSATLVIYNESGVGLRFSGNDTGVNFDLPAGGWKDVPIPVGETSLSYTALYVLSGSLVNKLIATLYAANEAVGVGATVGNSPVNGGTLNPASQVVSTGQVAPFAFVAGTVSAALNTFPTSEAVINNDGSSILGVLNNIVPAHKVTTDNAGNHYANTYTAGTSMSAPEPLLLLASNQETGYCGLQQANAVTLQAIGQGVNSKTIWPAIPSSISLAAISTVNATAIGTSQLKVDGFFLNFDASAAGDAGVIEHYTTVGL